MLVYLARLIDHTPPPVDWVLAVVSALPVFGGGRVPWVVLVCRLVLVVLSVRYAPVAVYLVPLLSAVALAELVLWRRGVASAMKGPFLADFARKGPFIALSGTRELAE